MRLTNVGAAPSRTRRERMCSERHTHKLDTITTILKAVADKLGVAAEGLDDGPKVEDLIAKLEDA